MTMTEPLINELPVELLSDIFSYSAESWSSRGGVKLDYRYKLARNSSPFSLTAVCRLWRSVAMSMPTLWDAICPTRNPIPLIEGWLSFIPAPYFDLMILEPYDKDAYEHVCAAFRAISRYFQKWRSLTIRLDSNLSTELSDLLGRVGPSTVPITRLDIRVHPSARSQEQLSSIIGSIPAFPALEHLSIEHRSRAKVSLENLPWSRLKSIRINNDFTFAQHVHYLSRCTMAQEVALEAYWIDLEGVTLPRPHSDPPFSLSNLTSLILSRGTDPLNLLSYFHLPNIERLILQVGHRNHSSFERFIKRTPALRLLVLQQSLDNYDGCPQPSEADLIDWLSASYLQHLPSFQLAFPDAHTAGPKILKKSDVQLPPLTCWEVDRRCNACTFVSPSVIGWGHSIGYEESVFWTARSGLITLTEFYRKKLHFCTVDGVVTMKPLGILNPEPW